MNQQTDPAAKAEAARAREEDARRSARKNTIVFGLAMFGIVFALLSFKYVTGSDPSLQTESLAAQREAAPAQPDEGWSGDWWGDDDSDEGDDGDDGDGGWLQQAPQGPPTSRAS